MLSDRGYIALILIFAFWIALTLIGFLVAFMPRQRFRKKSHRPTTNATIGE